MGELVLYTLLYLVWTVLFLSSVQGGRLLGFTPTNYPDPQSDHEACGRTKSSWVCDPGRYMTEQQVADLERNLGLEGGQNKNHNILVAIVPALLGEDGKATTSPELLPELAYHIRYDNWQPVGLNIVIVIHVIYGNMIWIQAYNDELTDQCGCNFNHGSHEFLMKTTHLPTLLNSYAKTLRNILAGTERCSTSKVSMPWRIFRMDSESRCSLNNSFLVSKMSPSIGPLEGGTEVRLIGENLDLTMVEVLIGSMPCLVTSRSSKVIVFLSTTINNPQQFNIPIPVYLRVGGNTFDTGQRYTYAKVTLKNIWPSSTTISGGLRMTVNGNNLGLVQSSFMITTLTGMQGDKTVEYTTSCEKATDTQMYCPTPTLELKRVQKQSSNGRRRRRRALTITKDISRERHRAIRAAGSNDDQSPIVNDIRVSVRVRVNGQMLKLDDVDGTVFVLSVYSDPTFIPFDGKDKTLTFISVWPQLERHINIKGTRLLPALKHHNISVRVGDAECGNVTIHSSGLVCYPPIHSPQVDKDHPPVQVFAGNIEMTVGYLEYRDTLWKYLPARYGFIGVLVGLIVISSLIITLCICCALRNKSSDTKFAVNEADTESMKETGFNDFDDR